MMTRVVCSYCNAENRLPAWPVPRVACVRCGESFVPTDPVEVEAAPMPRRVPAPTSSLRGPFLAGCAIAAVALAVGLYFVLGGKPPAVPTTRTADFATVPPAALAGLGHLPASANLAFAVQPGPLLEYAARTQNTSDDASAETAAWQLLQGYGLPTDAVKNALRVGKVRLRDIDHLAGGVTLASDNLLPGLCLVLKLRAPCADEPAFLAALKAEKKAKAGKPTYAVTLGLPLTLVKADETTYLFGLTDADVAGTERGAGPTFLKEALAKLNPASHTWLATADEDWPAKPLVKAALKDAKGTPPVLPRQALVGLMFEPEPKFAASLRGATPADGEKLRELLRGKPGIVSGEGAMAELAGDLPGVNLRGLLLGK